MPRVDHPDRIVLLAAVPPKAPSRRTQELAQIAGGNMPCTAAALSAMRGQGLVRESSPMRWLRTKKGTQRVEEEEVPA